MLEYDWSAAHRMVRQQRAAGNDVEWQGWDIVFYRPAENARTSKDGAWRNGEYAFANRVTVDESGLWKIDRRNIKRPKRTR